MLVNENYWATNNLVAIIINFCAKNLVERAAQIFSSYKFFGRKVMYLVEGHVHEKLRMFVSFLAMCLLSTILKYIENYLNPDLAHG